MDNALEKLDDNIEFAVEYSEYEEGHIYRLDLTGLVDEGSVGVFERPITDEFSSQTV